MSATLLRPDISTNPSYLRVTPDRTGKRNVPSSIIPQNTYGEAGVHNQECDMVCDSYECLPDTRDNWNVIHFLCTAKQNLFNIYIITANNMHII